MKLKQVMRQHNITQQALVSKIKELDPTAHISQSQLSEMIAGIKPISPNMQGLIERAIRELIR
jgi:DNA-binding transcriptional regulator YdaS (Cro superfamily)